MTHPHVSDNPFEQPAAESEGRMAFGALRVFTRKVNLTKGASYVLDALGIDPDNPDSPLNRLTYKDGNLYEFKGKQLAPAGNNTHVIVVITQRASDGRIYNNFRDFMYWDKDKSQKVTMPSLRAFFGRLLEDVVAGNSAEVQAEIVEIQDKQWTRQAFKIVKRFKDQAEREAAETAFFSQFQQTGAEVAAEIPGFEDEPMPWSDDGKPVVTAPSDAPVSMTKKQAVDLLPALWIASGQDKSKFLAQLAGDGMTVVLAALGGIDVPEITAVHSPEQDAIPA